MNKSNMEFKTEVKQLLDLMIHSLYSHKEIFLRELVSNASDAIDKARYQSLTDSGIMEKEADWKIKIIADKKAGTLTVTDNGIGMTREEIVQALGTIAHSGTKEFLAAIQSKDIKDNPELIGQFGVGFYSSFMVADSVTVISRKAGMEASQGVRWESSGEGFFSIEEVMKEGKGTDVVLHLKEDEKKYLEEWEIREIIRKYSDYIEHPIVMDVEREEESTLKKGEKVKIRKEERLNSGKAIWLRDRSQVSPEEYNEFYKHISHDFSDPARVIHYRAEGTSEFTALLYLPTKIPFDIYFKDYRVGPALYVKRVQIMDHCEQLIPLYLRFLRGVVDSSDLPLNISREMLQSNRQVEIIKKNVTKKVLDTLSDIKKNEQEKYKHFYQEFGRILKEGIHFDTARRETIADLLLYETTGKSPGELTDLEEYVKRMPSQQEEIYYIIGGSREEVAKSPYLEAFRQKGYEVLIMLDEIDDLIMGSLPDYKGKKIKSVTKGDVELDAAEKEEKEKAEKKFKELVELIRFQLKNEVKDVRFSGRLTETACCLVSDEGAMDPHMEKLLRSMGQSIPENKRILEINPSHPLLEAMKNIFDSDPRSPDLEEYIRLLYDQALLLEGSKPKDLSAFASAVTKLMVKNAEKRVS